MPPGSREPGLDVAIVGGGLAGNLLARQLLLTRPALRVAVFEKSTVPTYKVGEAIVEIASNYLIRKQRLSTYLYEHQLPKNGLRYFFDSAGRDCPLDEMSEVGTVNLPFHPAFQLDRARMEADLLEMNRRHGVEVRIGARVHEIQLGSEGALHRFCVEDERGSTDYSARWLVDAAGRVGLLARARGLRRPEPQHQLGSVWGRFEGVADIDTMGSEEFRKRVRHTARRLSTIHFWYPGHWIWFIPLKGGIVSVGVTGAVVARDRELRREEGFLSFLKKHRATAALLAEAKLVDIGCLARISYGTDRFFHPDRWGLTGEAATSADPLYSPGSDFIALENDFLTDLIVRDADGEEEALLGERLRLYDEFMKFRHESTMLLYAGLYDTLGSYELCCAKWDFDIGSYYNLWVDSYLRDRHLDPDYLRNQLRLRPLILQGLRNVAALFRRVARHLEESEQYYRNNRGHFHYGLAQIDFAERVGCDRSESEELEETAKIFNRFRARAAELLGEAPSADAVTPLPLSAFLVDRPLL